MLIVLGLYVAVQMAIGFWVARRVRSEDDYLLAGRKLGPVLAIASMFATWFGAESCIAAAGAVYEGGVGPHSVEPFAYGVCIVLLGLLFAARLWRAGITTLADLFQKRHGTSTSVLAAVLMVPTSLLWAAAQVRAFGHVLATNSDGLLGDEAGIAIAAAVVVVYTGAGGLLADVMTDLVQGIVLIVGLLLLLAVAVAGLGGVDAAAARLHELPPRAPAETLSWSGIVEAWAVPVCGSIVAQEAIARALASRSPSVARWSGLGGGALYILIGLIPVALGLLGPLYVPGLENSELLLPTLARDHMPAWVHVLFTGALVSAMLSTVDSCLLAASAVLTRNAVLRDRAVSPRTRLWVARGASVACGVAAWALAHVGDSVGGLVEQASGFGSAGILVVMVWSLFGGPGSAFAANAALLSGIGAWVLGAYVFEVDLPFLLSLAAAVAGLAVGMLLRARRSPPAPA